MAKLKSGTRIYGTATIDTSVVVGSAVTLSSSGVQVTGISTLGTVQISSGIVTATTGIITYYGDGSRLSNIISGVSISTNTTNQNQFLTYTTGTGTTTGFGITTTGLVFNPSTGNLGIGTTSATQKLQVQGNVLVSGISTLGVTSATNLTSQQLNVSGISTLGTLQVSSGIVTATTGIITYYGDGSRLTGVSAADSYLFNTGVTSSFSAALIGIGATIFTFPATAGKEYIVLSINCSNVAAGNTEVNVIGAFDFNGGERSYFAYNIPIPTGTSVEIMKQPQVMNPSDRIVMRSTNFSRVGTDSIIETYVTYQEKTSTSYFGVGLGTVGLATTDITGIYTSTTYPSVIQSIRLTNVTDTGAYPVSVQITNGLTTTRLVDNLIVPKYGNVELLDAPKRIEVNSRIEVQLDQGATMGIQVSGSQITSKYNGKY